MQKIQFPLSHVMRIGLNAFIPRRVCLLEKKIPANKAGCAFVAEEKKHKLEAYPSVQFNKSNAHALNAQKML
jgi:hypothetical protein